MAVGISMVTPIREMPLARLTAVKEYTKRELLSIVMEGKANAKETDFIVREMLPGDGTNGDLVSDFNFRATIQTAGLLFWAQDATTITAATIYKLGNMVVDNQLVAKNTAFGVYGVMDLDPEQPMFIAATATKTPPLGPVTTIEFKRGGSLLARWDLQGLYVYEEVIGISEAPVFWKPEEGFEFWLSCTEITKDKFIGLRAYVCEPVGKMTPDEATFELISSNGTYNLRGNRIAGGIDPIQELTLEEIQFIYNMAAKKIVQMMLDANVVTSEDQCYVRRATIGGNANAAAGLAFDGSDFEMVDTGATSVGEAYWHTLPADLAAAAVNRLCSFFKPGQTVKSGKMCAVIGFFDRGFTPSNFLVSIETGGKKKDIWQTEHCYAYRDGIVSGFTFRPSFFKQTDVINPRFSVQNVIFEQYIGLHMLICETWGNIVSRA